MLLLLNRKQFIPKLVSSTQVSLLDLTLLSMSKSSHPESPPLDGSPEKINLIQHLNLHPKQLKA